VLTIHVNDGGKKMKRFTMFACLALALFAMSSVAGELPQYTKGDSGTLYGGVTNTAKASRDTFVMIGPWGSGAVVNGQFEDEAGQPHWNGWTHYDITQPTVTHWQVSDYFADNLPGGAGNLAAWCGDIGIAACSEADAEGGYGNAWNDIIEWRGTVGNPGIGVDVTFVAVANIDSEPGYDYTNIVYYDADGRFVAASFDGDQPALPINVAFSLGPVDYQGENSDEVVVQVNFTSDGAWSDADCLWPTAGAVQIDDIIVTMNQGAGDVVSTTDFEDGTFGDWAIAFPVGVGDFAQLWTNLEDIDPCNSNFSAQVAFIDDGEVIPGVGPSLCIDWCYGPGGYIVNTTGGAAGPDFHLYNAVESPVIAWPDPSADGAFLQFNAYRHEDLSADAPGIFYTWSVRSTASADPDDIAIESWADENFVYYGGPDYLRTGFNVTNLMVNARQYTQVQLTAYELGYAWDWVGNDGYPAPYFDNVRYIAYPFYGPALSTREIDIANDNFPAIGEVDLVNLGNNSIRFDMARDISLGSEEYNLPGDTIVFDIVPVRPGADFVSDPEIVVAMKANPLFDAFRVLPAGFTQTGDLIEGALAGAVAENAAGPVPGKWAFDLPDENFFFPGDIIHYFIRATDTDGVEEQTATFPPKDIDAEAPDGFGDFSRALAYSSSYTVRGLPTVYEDPLNPGSLVTPGTLFWNDFANRGGEEEWHGAFANLGLLLGRDYDTYYTNGPSSGVGNGLGGRATALSLIDYDNMVYTAGDLGVNTISNGDFNNDSGNDLEVVDSWLRQGNKDLFLSGDDLVSDLVVNGGAAASQFVADWMKVTYVTNNLRPLINNQATPLVKAVLGNGIFADSDTWIAYGGCFGINTFDAITADAANGGVQLAEFTDPNGAAGAYSYSAATLYEDVDTGSRVISLPYDLMYVYTNPDAAKAPAGLPARAVLLEQSLAYFGVEGDPLDVSPVPGADKFAVRNYPNPFNPTTKIEYTMPKAGHLTLKIYNVKGELVKTLIDDQIETSGSIMWDGTNDNGAKVSSGVYFYEARTAGQVQVEKMALVK
jgi:hypothetical protein